MILQYAAQLRVTGLERGRIRIRPVASPRQVFPALQGFLTRPEDNVINSFGRKLPPAQADAETLRQVHYGVWIFSALARAGSSYFFRRGHGRIGGPQQLNRTHGLG